MHGRSPSRALVVVAVTIALAWGGTWTARAQLVGGGLLGGSTTTTTAPPATTTTTAPRPTTTAPPPAATTPPPTPEGGGEPELPPPAPPPAASPGPEPGGDQGPAPAGAPGGGPPPPPPAAAGAPGAPGPPGAPGGEPLPPAGDDGEVPPPDAGPFPAHLRALMDSVERTGSNNTRALMEALAPLGRYGLTPEQAAIVGFGRFPVAGEATYSHDWWFPRFGPGWRLHQGTDIFAARGTPVRAPVDGSVRIRNGGLGGLSVYVTGADRTYYYLAHLAGIAPGLVDGATVETGDVVGYVGDSGNARGGLPHVHFEVHPGGGGPIDPKPVLDRYVSDALAAAGDVVGAYAEAARSAGNGRPALPEPPEVEARDMDGLRSTLLWLTSVNPSAGAVQLAQAEAVQAGAQVDWSRAGAQDRATGEPRAAAQDRATGQARAEAVRRVDLWLRPLVPPALAAALS
jgi:hypothetical protein